MQRRHLIGAIGSVPFAALPLRVLAQLEGDKPITIVVPFGPGGSGDITARLLAEYIAKKTGRTTLVDNKPGANGIVGVEVAKKGPADGSVLLLSTTSTHSANPSLFKKLPYAPGKDFVLVGHFGNISTFMVVRPDAPWKTLADFVQAAKAAPGKINYGHFNASSLVPGVLLGQVAGIELAPIPYKQVGTAMTELMAGQIQVIFIDSAAGNSAVSAGQVRALAAHGQKRLARFPLLPLITETYPNYDISGFLGLSAPTGTAPAILQALNELVNEAITTEPMKSKLENFGIIPAKMTLAELAKWDNAEREKWKTYVAMAKIEPQ